MLRTFIALVLSFAALGTARANMIEMVSIDTTALVGQGKFYAYFQFTSTNGNNTVTVSNFNFDPGLVLTLPTPPGSFFSEIAIPFTAGPTLKFQVELETNPPVVKFPDEFSFALLDSQQNALPTSDPLGLNALMTIGLPATGASLITFVGAGDPLQSGPAVDSIQSPNPVPEPVSSGLSGVALLGGFLVRRRLRRKASGEAE